MSKHAILVDGASIDGTSGGKASGVGASGVGASAGSAAVGSSSAGSASVGSASVGSASAGSAAVGSASAGNASAHHSAPALAGARHRPWGLVAAIVIFLVAANLPYVWLMEHFGYDDVLREPAGTILSRFAAGGAPLVLAWLAFAISSLLFIPVALGLRKLLAQAAVPDAGAFGLALASAVAQAIGLMRWVLVVPPLAASYNADYATDATRASAVLLFDIVHRYGGMVIGEFIGQMLLAGWTLMLASQLLRAAVVPPLVAWLGLLTVPLWLLGQTEVLHAALPGLPVIETVPLAFMTWEVWLLLLALKLAWQAVVPISAVHLNQPLPTGR